MITKENIPAMQEGKILAVMDANKVLMGSSHWEYSEDFGLRIRDNSSDEWWYIKLTSIKNIWLLEEH